MNLKRILLYSPDVIGHPRVYCRVIADALREGSCQLVVAMGFTDDVGLNESPDLVPLATRNNVQLLDTRSHSRSRQPHLSAEELVGLQHDFNIDTTLFIEADKSNDEFARIATGQAPPLRGRNLGIFAKTAEWYPGEDSFTGERCRLLAPTVRITIGNIKRAIFNRHTHPRHFYEKTIIGARVLDELIVKDERLADWYGPPVYWMPEISRPIAAAETPEEEVEYSRRKRELDAFLAANQGREPVLYFGDAAFYKGYDLFLEFVAGNQSTCAIHPGRTYNEGQKAYFRSDVELLRKQLRSEGRLHETNEYVHTQRLKELFFSAIRVYITTHRLALSSSTVIQAAEQGKPVLVPDRGLLGYRVRKNNLGGVYQYEDMSDLRFKAEKLWKSNLREFSVPISRFWARFSDSALNAFFMQRILAHESE